jgi:hypothetical protein
MDELQQNFEQIKIEQQPSIYKYSPSWTKKLFDYIQMKEEKIKNVKLCIENGGDIHYNDDLLLKIACREGHKNIVNLLFEYNNKIKTTAKNNFKFKESLFWAATNGHWDILMILKNQGANLKDLNKQILKDYHTREHRLIILYCLAHNIDIKTNKIFIKQHLEYDRLKTNGMYSYPPEIIKSVLQKL